MKQNVNLNDIFKHNYICKSKLNNSKTKLAFLVVNANKNENKYDSNLFIIDIKTKEVNQLTSDGKINDFCWDNNEEIIFDGTYRNKEILSLIDRGETWSSIYKININHGEAKHYFDVKLNIVSIDKLNNHKYIFKVVYNPFKKIINDIRSPEKEKINFINNENNDYYIINKSPIAINGLGYTNDKYVHLYLYSKKDDNYKCLNKKEQFCIDYTIYNNKILFITSSFNEFLISNNGLYLYDDTRDDIKSLIIDKDFRVQFANLVDDNDVICGIEKYTTLNKNINSKLYHINTKNLEWKCINQFDFSYGNTIYSDVSYNQKIYSKVFNNYIYLCTTENYFNNIYKINKNGDVFKVFDTKNNGSIIDFEIIDENNLIINLSKDNNLYELFLFNNSSLDCLTEFNKSYIQNKNICDVKVYTYKEINNIKFNGFVIYPSEYCENKKYPVILLIHGGPKIVYSNQFNFEAQLLASNGYFVVYCNPRGSDGKGNSFSNIVGKFGVLDYLDIIDFINWFKDQFKNNINENKIGVIGNSYGGYMVNWIITHTNIFKAAISCKGISNLKTMFFTSDIGKEFVFKICGTSPFENSQKVDFHSPINYLNNVKTPTLFLHPELDYRCNLNESLQMYNGLKYKNIESKLVIFKNENHNILSVGKPNHKIKWYSEILNWLKKHL
ncbi:alpha/beta hydrolase family protein [Malacoplasma iowae]|uniref:alpha/beta hydrolase family protein n=1 Tax=Malacoplasma iowae TaxID=2116 RepID=UPI002A18CD7B|nr:S9 family peptidase [Malacoplasma iowae]WPL36537.1 S9 family peptidase [Malacoplasma iowae]WPL38295.1 S9 family peptidase [Malacoplasma iowae]